MIWVYIIYCSVLLVLFAYSIFLKQKSTKQVQEVLSKIEDENSERMEILDNLIKDYTEALKTITAERTQRIQEMKGTPLH
ncbi:hypothetical protein MOE86_15580 [Bacillus atrophaeus]|uniref:hypothetical protein n=1 Tax=Bacillus atrophaeus TaxID=1452 RepID=UPI00227EE3B5|nr:hypothetical protein [Bacillus atrophaeus]MCY9198099.1 hypothetical protein [Bacillus atrophaeus]